MSLARANERVHLHNERNFFQAKLDSERNVPFLLNEQGDLYFLLHNNSVHIVLFNLKEFQKIYRTEKKIWVKAFTVPILWGVNYDHENRIYEPLRPRRFKSCDFLKNFI